MQRVNKKGPKTYGKENTRIIIIIIGQVEGLRRQGRSRLRWMDSIKETMGFGLEKLKEIVEDRNKWRRLVEEKTRKRERTNINIKR
jgi:hypothetical protein